MSLDIADASLKHVDVCARYVASRNIWREAMWFVFYLGEKKKLEDRCLRYYAYRKMTGVKRVFVRVQIFFGVHKTNLGEAAAPGLTWLCACSVLRYVMFQGQRERDLWWSRPVRVRQVRLRCDQSEKPAAQIQRRLLPVQQLQLRLSRRQTLRRCVIAKITNTLLYHTRFNTHFPGIHLGYPVASPLILNLTSSLSCPKIVHL